MSLHVRTDQQDNMFFGPNATYASVVRGEGKDAVSVKDFAPPFARLRARFYVLLHWRL